jgi:hypothetical protein
MANLTEDIGRVVRIFVRMLVLHGWALTYRQCSGLSLGDVGKACGTTADMVRSWELGISEPTVAQAIAWWDVLTRNQGRTNAMGPLPAGAPAEPAWQRNGHAAAEPAVTP